MLLTALLCLLGYVFWFVLFSPAMSGAVDFWLVMILATGLLSGCALFIQRNKQPFGRPFRPIDLVWGVAGAIVLYGVFFLGNGLIRQVLSFGENEIGRIYGIREGYSPVLIALWLFFWIGPAEEIFWRGFLQRRLGEKLGETKGYVLASCLYGLGHCWSMNLTLLLAALVCGFFWGWMFRRTRSLWPGLISHAVWDVLIFVVFPLS